MSGGTKPAKPKTVRLDRLLANLGYGSRRLVQALVADGAVTLDGETVQHPDDHVALAPDLSDRLSISGAPLDPLPPLTLVLHKPLGVVCSHREPGRSVYDLLPERWRLREPSLSTVGRLDKETSGLLLLTDDGGLLHRIISPKANIEKRYRATLERPLSGSEGALFASGTMMLEGEKTPLLPATLEVLSPTDCSLSIREGRYHQVRRMFGATGNVVIALHRDRIGSFSLPVDLAPGSYRGLREDELALVFG